MSATELGVAYLSIVPSIKGLQGRMAEQLAPAEAEAKTAGLKAGEGFSTGFSSTVAKAGTSVTALSEKAKLVGNSFSSASSTAIASLDRLGSTATVAGSKATEAMTRYTASAERAAGGNAGAIASLDRFGAEATSQAARAEGAMRAYAVAAETAGTEAGAGLARGTEAGLARVTGSVEKASGAMKGLAGGLLAGFAISGGLEVFKDAAKAAGDDAKAARLVHNAFGDASETVLKFGEDAANSFGLSAGAANMAAATFGRFLAAFKIGGQQAADMSTKLVGLSADIAKTTGADVATVEAAMQSALKGRGNALKQFGINVSAANIAQEAFTHGIAAQGAKLNDTQKAMAIYFAILDQTKNAQGGFARTAGTMGTSQQILTANLDNLAAKLGKAVIPLLSTVSQIAVNVFLPALQGIFAVIQPLINGFAHMSQPLKDIVAGMGLLLLLKGPLISMFTALKAGMLSAFANPVGLAIVGIAAAMLLFYNRTHDTGIVVSDLTDTLDKNTTAITGNTRAMIVQDLQTAGVLDSARKLGVSLPLVTDAAEGLAGAHDKLAAALADSGAKALAANSIYSDLSPELAKAGISATDMTQALMSGHPEVVQQLYAAYGATLVKGSAAQKLFNIDQIQLNTLIAKAPGIFAPYNAILADTGTEAAGLSKNQRDLKVRIDATAASLTASTMAATSGNKTLNDSYRNTSDQATRTANTTAATAKGLRLMATGQDQAKASAVAGAAAWDKWGVQLKHAMDGTADVTAMNATIKKTSDAANAAAQAVLGLSINIDILDHRDVPLEEAQKNLNAQILTMSQAFKDATTATHKHAESLIDSTGKIHTETKAGQDLFDAVTAYKGAYDTSVIAAEKAAGAHATVAQKVKAAQGAAQAARQAFIDQAVTVNHLTIPAATALADHMGILEGKKLTPKVLNLSAEDKATAKLDALQQKINSFQDKVFSLTVTDKATGAFTTSSGQKGFAGGGYISGPGSGTSDSINARLSDGEFVVKADAVRANRALLEHINNGFAGGGMVNVKMLERGNALAGVSAFMAGAISSAQAQAKAAAIPKANNSGTEQWRALANHVAMMKHEPLASVQVMLNQMSRESGGNPAAINLTDINAQQGHPSEGLLQFIQGTFNRYSDPGYNTNIWDPESQMRAWYNYINPVYGGYVAFSHRGYGAYADGGLVHGPGSGRSDSINARVSNGEFVVNAASTANHLADLMAINGGLGAGGRGFASGGLVSAGALAGIVPGQPGPRLGLVQQALTSDIPAMLAALQANANAAAQAANAAIHIARMTAAQRAAAIEAENLAHSTERQVRASVHLQLVQRNQDTVLQRLAARYDSVTTGLANAQQNLSALQQNKAGLVASTVTAAQGFGGGLTGFSAQRGTFASILNGQVYNAGQLRMIQGQASNLRAKGLNSDAIQQVINAALGGDDTTALALARATPAQIKQLNAVMSGQTSTGNAIGNTLGNSMYASGIAAAQGLVNGLKSQQSAINRQMELMAASMAAAMKRALGIRSPSTVFHNEVGIPIAQGVITGMASQSAAVSRGVQGLVKVPSVAGQRSGPIDYRALADAVRDGMHGTRMDLRLNNQTLAKAVVVGAQQMSKR